MLNYWLISKIKSNQKRICIAPYIPQIQRRLADGLREVGATIQISFKVFFESEYSVSVNNIDRQTVPQRRCSDAERSLGKFSARSGAACWKVGASVTGCDRSAVNLGTAVMTSDSR